MGTLKFRHTTINSQEFLFSTKENKEESYLVAYSLVRNLLIGMAKRARVFCSNKYDFADYPFTYRERQLDSILLPELSKLCNGFVFTETGEDWEIPVYQVTHGGLREKFYKYHGKALEIKLRRY